ncbi:hypothetical protein GLOIN_2v1488698 [Rhizophagus clarus]|uniref:HECT domain-containing protein n=1 Tax=Rhizophagus clarus TaxID=94130 RepID=A0A8H3MEY1_9GLOM|nr:hypothetical protein GLOIN_2v1488698 [Rhizophagus clarus]
MMPFIYNCHTLLVRVFFFLKVNSRFFYFCRLISFSILNDVNNFIILPNNLNKANTDNITIDEKSYSDNEIILEYEVDDHYTINTSISINIRYNPSILNANEITRWAILWVYLFQDIFVLPQTPIKVYPYYSIIQQLELLLSKQKMEDLLESCFNCEIDDDVFANIYEGRVWKIFTDTNGQPFFVKNILEVHIGFALNLDCFNNDHLPATRKTSGEQPLISVHNLKKIQRIIDATPPSSNGLLRDILPEEYWQYWQSFIDCLSLWRQTIITREEIENEDLIIRDFLAKVKSCFPFERLNGYLASISNSERNFAELQTFQHEDKGIIAKYNFTIQEALYFKSLPFQISQMNIRGYESIPDKLLNPICELTLKNSLVDCLVGYYE